MSRMFAILFAMIVVPACEADRPSSTPVPPPEVVTQPVETSSDVDRAFAYLMREMDVYHARTVIYDDSESGGERFYPSGWMGDPDPWLEDRLVISDSSDNPHSGTTCLRLTWRPSTPRAWAGVYWQYPENNWGKQTGRDLSDARELEFWARGQNGGEHAEFKFGGIEGPQVTIGTVALSSSWTRHTLRLPSKGLSNVIGGFCWVTNAYQNRNGCTIYLDDITIAHQRLNEPRLIRSYHVGADRLGPLMGHVRNACYTYDNAVAICAFLSSALPEHQRRARLLADALVALVQKEQDGAIRNAYCCGDLLGYGPSTDGAVSARCPWRRNPGGEGHPDPKAHPVLLDTYAMEKDCGVVAWTALALLNCWQATDDRRYLDTSRRLARWLEGQADTQEGVGIPGGLRWDSKQEMLQPVTWRSTEHNIDCAALFSRLAREPAVASEAERSSYSALATSCEQFVEWAQSAGTGGLLVTGTLEGSAEPRTDLVPLDPQTWSVMVFPGDSRYVDALNLAVERLRWDEGDVWGLRYSDKSESIWLEGTAQAALAQALVGESGATLMEQIEKTRARVRLPTAAAGGIAAAYPKEAASGFGWSYLPYAHVGATSWYILAKNQWNPFSGKPVAQSD